MKFVFVLISAVVLGGTVYAGNIKDELLQLGITVVDENVESIDFELEDLDGTVVKLSSLRGNMIFLNFWATWCGPCRAEMPSMQRIYDKLKDKGFVILAVNLREDNKPVNNFMDELGLDFTVLLDRTGKVGAQYGVRSIPTTYLIDRDGSIIGRAIGAREWDAPEYQSIFEKILRNGID